MLWKFGRRSGLRSGAAVRVHMAGEELHGEVVSLRDQVTVQLEASLPPRWNPRHGAWLSWETDDGMARQRWAVTQVDPPLIMGRLEGPVSTGRIRHRRVTVSVPIEVQFVKTASPEYGMTRDCSETGVRFRVHTSCRVGQHCVLTMRFGVEQIAVAGKVVRVSAEDRHWDVAVAYERLPRRTAEALRQALAREIR